MIHMTLGISGKSQFLFALVYTTRYLDLLTNFVSLYNSVMKVYNSFSSVLILQSSFNFSLQIVFLGGSYGTLYLMYMKFRATYDSNHDTFR